MRKPWSISTTVRNPERIRDFLRIIKSMEGEDWTRPNQRKFQILLIQNKLYGYGSQQFYNDLSRKHLKLMDNDEIIKFEEAEEILDSKGYTGGGDMRGRQSFNPLEKMGLVFLDEKNKIRISAVGKIFLKENYDLGEVFFKSFLKWQLPNTDSNDFKKEDGFDIKPFIATLHLIDRVNKKWSAKGNKPVGISRKEFSLFIPTLINYKDIEEYSEEIIKLRISSDKQKNKKEFFKKYSYIFVEKFLDTKNKKLVERTLKNLKEYTDNIIRYFRLTRYIYIRGNGYYVDLEPRRSIEIKSLIKVDSGKAIEFKNRSEYLEYFSDITKPKLPWDNLDSLKEIAKTIILEVKSLEKEISKELLKKKDYLKLDLEELKIYIEELRNYRRRLQEEIEHDESQDVKNVRDYIEILDKNIYGMEERPLVLEKYVTLGLNALNDALRIKPNYPVGDDNEPTNTAPAGKPDIECFYEEYNSICEVTLLKDRSQWFNEGQPVMRHLREFEEENSEKETYCLFIAPSLHVDTLETFWMAINYGYKGKKQKIIPITLNQFVKMLKVLLAMKEKGERFTRDHLLKLYISLLDLRGIENSDQWVNEIYNRLNKWGKVLTNGRAN